MAYVSRYLHMAAHFLSGLVTLSLWNLLSQKPLSAIAVFVLLVRAVPIGRTGAFFSFLLSSFILSLVTHMRPMYIMDVQTVRFLTAVRAKAVRCRLLVARVQRSDGSVYGLGRRGASCA